MVIIVVDMIVVVINVVGMIGLHKCESDMIECGIFKRIIVISELVRS